MNQAPETCHDLPEWQATRGAFAERHDGDGGERQYTEVVEAAFRMRDLEQAWEIASEDGSPPSGCLLAIVKMTPEMRCRALAWIAVNEPAAFHAMLATLHAGS